MMKSMIREEVSLASIAHFLDHTVSAAMNELDVIQKRNEDGAFAEYEDYEAAVSYPLARLRLACRAVYHEINCLMEHSLYMAAHEPWLKSKNSSGPKTLFDLPENLTSETLKSLRMVTDLGFKQVLTFIEDYYKLRLEGLPGWDQLADLRKAVNAFKHRDGYVDFRKIDDPKCLDERYEVSVERARAGISAAREFLRAFHDAVSRAKAPDRDYG